jgi:uncharacterized protein (DUF1697 family)
MVTYVALLRAVNVGGTGKLPMSELRNLCEECGFRHVQTYIASGNIVFETDYDEAGAKAALQTALRKHTGKTVDVLIRNAAETAGVLAANPYPDHAANLVHVIFLDEAPPSDYLARVSGRTTEEIASGLREIYVYYPQGQGASKLKLAAAKAGTARNLNTVAKLCELSAG